MDTGIAPEELDRAIVHQRSHVPDDANALDRLLDYLDATRPTAKEIKAAVCEFYCVHPFEISGRHCIHLERRAHISIARQMFCYFAHKYARLTMPKIFPLAGYRDHSSVFYAIRRVEGYIVTRPLWADDVDLLRLRISEKMLLRPQGRAS